jgi:methanethiol S-methyltransferase
MSSDTRAAGPAGSAFAWLGASLFAAALGWFVYSYFVRFPALVPDGRAGLAWDVALFTLFAAHHSIFARDGARLWVERTFPGRERTVFVWTASLLFLGVCSAWRAVTGTVWTVEGAGAWAFYAMRLFGIALTLRAAAILDVWELAGTRPPRHAPGNTGGEATFTRRGPYGWVRHPIYAAWFLVVFAVPNMTATQLVFAVVSCAYLFIGMVFEERSLVRAAPRAYEEYRRQVRWKVIPGIY